MADSTRIIGGEGTKGLEQLIERLGRFRAKVPRTLKNALQLTLLESVADVTKNKMSGQVLGVVTGTARRSMRWELRANEQMMIGAFGSHHEYVRAHELGFKGTVQVRAHTRRLRLTRINRKGERVKRSERQRLGDALQGRKTTAQVRSHARNAHIREKHFMRDTWLAMTGTGSAFARNDTIRAYTIRGLRLLVQTGEVPTIQQIKSAGRS